MSKVEIDVPFIEQIIRGMKKDDTAGVIDLNYKRVGEKGDNYTSEVNRIIIKCILQKDGNEVEEELSLFMKKMHIIESESLGNMLQSIFNNEMMVMAGPLRRMKEILGVPRTAQLLYNHTEDPQIAIMEDLTPLGFSMASRKTGFDLQHASLVVRNLAQFHASSVAVYEETPEYKVQFREHLFKNPNDGPAEFVCNGFKDLGTEISGWKELGPKYGDKLKNLGKGAYPKTRMAFAPRENEFTVLTHGDCSQINMLFAYDEQKKPTRVALVDFQHSCYNSPAVDLRCILSDGVTQEVHQHHQYSLLAEYQSVLSETMKKLNCKTPIPSLEDIKKMYDDRIFVSVVCTCLIEPILRADASDVVSMDDMVSGGTEDSIKRYRGDYFRKILIARLPEYYKLGLLDV